MISLHKNQSGDTLVEVLIAIAVVSSVLGITYGIMNRNLITMRDNQERTEAVKVAQAQIEALKNARDNNDAALATQRSQPGEPPFCFDAAGNVVDLPGDSTPADTIAADVPANYPPGCQRQGLYRTGMDPLNNLGDFRIYVRWDRIGGGVDGGVAEVVMVYQLR